MLILHETYDHWSVAVLTVTVHSSFFPTFDFLKICCFLHWIQSVNPIFMLPYIIMDLPIFGLCVSWDKLMSFLDNRMVKKEEYIRSIMPPNIPVILLLDNINIHRSKRWHLQLLRNVSLSIWNLIGRAVLVPNLESITELFTKKETALVSQRDVLQMRHEDILYQFDETKTKLFEDFRDFYILTIMDIACNEIPKKEIEMLFFYL